MPPRVIHIFSENNDFQYVDALRRRREKRHRQREFFVEGVRPITQALAYGWPINAFLYARNRRLSDWATGILAGSRARTHLELSSPLLQKLSNKAETPELIALVGMPEDDLSRIPIRHNLCVVIFDRPANPGNLGTIIRSCDALRVDGLIVAGHAVDLYDPETISATTGSFFALPVVRVAGPGDLLPWFDAIRRTIGAFALVGTSATASRDLAGHDFTGPTVLVIGNETWGLSAGFRDLCDTLVAIPMVGSASSLNVACATSILLYEIDRQRRGRGMG